jgi:hypothetical protein
MKGWVECEKKERGASKGGARSVGREEPGKKKNRETGWDGVCFQNAGNEGGYYQRRVLSKGGGWGVGRRRGDTHTLLKEQYTQKFSRARA